NESKYRKCPKEPGEDDRALSFPHTTFGKSGHRAWHWSLMLAARLRGQLAVSASSAGRLRPPDERRRPGLRTGRKNPRCLSVGWRCLHGGGTARRPPPPSRNQPPEPSACASPPDLRKSKSLRKGRQKSIRSVRTKCVRVQRWSSVHS